MRPVSGDRPRGEPRDARALAADRRVHRVDETRARGARLLHAVDVVEIVHAGEVRIVRGLERNADAATGEAAPLEFLPEMRQARRTLDVPGAGVVTLEEGVEDEAYAAHDRLRVSETLGWATDRGRRTRC